MNDLIQGIVNFRNYNHSDVDSLIVFPEGNAILPTTSLSSAGIESMHAKWEEMFGVKDEDEKDQG